MNKMKTVKLATAQGHSCGQISKYNIVELVAVCLLIVT